VILFPSHLQSTPDFEDCPAFDTFISTIPDSLNAKQTRIKNKLEIG